MNIPKGGNLAIGKMHAGGIIFYLDASGRHGLVCMPYNQSNGIKWNNNADVDTYERNW